MDDNDAIGALEYDLQRFLQVDLRGLFASPKTITYRQVITWIRYLPGDSALAKRGLGGDVKYTLNDHLAAATLNTLSILDWHYVSAHSEDKPDIPELIDLNR